VRRSAPQGAEQRQIRGFDPADRLVLDQHHLVIGRLGVVFPAQRIDRALGRA
jgi:hypothetical protein